MVQVTYTNRKGKTYYLCRGVTKTGKPRYYFATEPKGEPAEEVPEGYEIRESVNGVVSLAKKRAIQILPEERAAVEAAIKRHPKARNYRVDVKGKQIVVYERVGPDAEDLSPLLRSYGQLSPSRLGDLQEFLDQSARFTPVMRFRLLDEDKRTFCTERWSYLASIDDWIQIGPSGPVHLLAQRYIPLLGSNALYDVL
jgi:hypothetical protein